MNIIRALLLFFVVAVSSTAAAREVAANPKLAGAPMSTDSPGDGETEGSPNAGLRGALSAEGVYVESDAHGAEGEEGSFETGTPEFLQGSLDSGTTCGINKVPTGDECCTEKHCYSCCSTCCRAVTECSEVKTCIGLHRDYGCDRPLPPMRKAKGERCLRNGDCCSGNCRKNNDSTKIFGGISYGKCY